MSRSLLAAHLFALAIAGCTASGPAGAAPGAKGAPPAVQVVTETVAPGIWFDAIPVLGTVRAVAQVQLTAKGTGMVRELPCAEGQLVEAGALVCRLGDDEDRALVAEAESLLAERERDRGQAEQLLASGAATRDRVAAAQAALLMAKARVGAARARLDDLVVMAPFAGRLGLVQPSIGALLTPGAPIATLASPALKVEFSLPEVHLPALRPGLTLRASAPAVAEVLTGTVSAIDSVVDPATRQVRVTARLGEVAGLRPGQSLRCELVLGEQADALTVPEEAVVVQGTSCALFTVVDGAARRTPVVLGGHRAGRFRIASGLKPGDRVVVRGVQWLRDGVAVAAAPPASAAAASVPAVR
jgi:membrane fusion protein (multidrug efflux system)